MSFELARTITKYLDPHVALLVVEHFQDNKIHNPNHVALLKVTILLQTKMFDYTLENIDHLDESSKKKEEINQLKNDINNQKLVVANNLTLYSTTAAPVIKLIDEKFADLEKEKFTRAAWNKVVEESGQAFKQDVIDAAVRYARTIFDCGQYQEALKYVQCLSSLYDDDEAQIQLLWGRLTAEVLLGPKPEAYDTIKALRGKLDASQIANHMFLLANRAFVLHTALMLYLRKESNEQDLNLLGDLFVSENYLNVIQISCPYLLRYLIGAIILSKNHQFANNFGLQNLAVLIDKEVCDYKDSLVEFIRALLIDYDFERARDQLKEFPKELANDYFLSTRIDALVNAARVLIFETYCKLYNNLEISMVSSYLEVSREDAEVWIVNLIRNANIEAKIDSERGIIVITNQIPNVYDKIMNKTRDLVPRTNILINNIKRFYSKVQ